MTRELKVSPVTGTIGAELSGVDLAGARATRRRRSAPALLANRVIFFRDQALDYESQVAVRGAASAASRSATRRSSRRADQPLMEEVDSARARPLPSGTPT